MKALFTLIFLLFCHLSLAESLRDRAIREGWTFEFDESHPKYATGFRPSVPKNATYDSFKELDTPIPDTYDLRPSGISPIQDQGNCGSCWAFSITAMLQSNLMLNGIPPTGLLSQQYLVDCARDMYGCNGGMFEAANWVVDPKGPATLLEYPYTARNGRCKNLPAAGSALEWHYIGANSRKPTTEEIQRAILLYGEVSVTVGADNALAAYKSGIYNACSRAGVNHMVDLVGWDNTQGYWIMRNSWGVKWGESGWGRIKYVGRSGGKCNNLADQAIYIKTKEKPVPPTPKEFTMESNTLSIVVRIEPQTKITIDSAKKVLQPILNQLDRM